MTTVRDFDRFFAARIPYEMKEDFDNVGLLVGMNDTEVKKVLIALDITSWTVEEAVSFGAQLIISHHPLFFSLKRITDSEPTGKTIVSLISSGISAICLHTNLDSAAGGVNDALLEMIGASGMGILDEAHESKLGAYGIGRYGELPEAETMTDFLARLKILLKTNGLRYHDAGRRVSRIAVCGGSGGEFLEKAVSLGCDTYITADIKYDRFLTAKELGINLIDADHFCTENVVVPVLERLVRESFPDVGTKISEIHTQTAKFFA